MANKILICIIFLFSTICAFSQTVKSSSTIVNLTKADFLQKVANYETNPEKFIYLGDKPCIIDFYADWCGPCRMLTPILEELSKEYTDKIYIYKINIDKERELAALFGVRSIPSVLFVPQTDIAQMAVGLYPKAIYVQIINKFLLKN